MVKVLEPQLLEMATIRLAGWNPNVQDEATFNGLTENIEEVGFDSPIQVRVLPAEELGTLTADEQARGVKYEVIGGHHRYKAMALLGAEAIWGTVQEGMTLKQAKRQNVRHNIQTGKLDPIKFTEMFDEVAKEGDRELEKQMMGFTDEKMFRQVYKEIRQALPPELRSKLAESSEELKKIDDLSLVLNTMFTRYGSTLDRSFMCFVWGGKLHWMIDLDKNGFRAMKALEAFSTEAETDMNVVLGEALMRHAKALHSEAAATALAQESREGAEAAVAS